ncbi:myc box-dependent-interacting protein 1 isoform X2 [Condylostylus longicornis]|uniref:myc box-dependent-interacting protein 1 isoform X2 n=1 Tax=Condylostylus longicornis TaxID=2530218 RepID=UPI00244DBF17|nr:myc box-dependent-interacting protein 1 isoform X2 [Condylostylus longicornis]
MAEKGALLAKSVQKHAGRAKEKILQNLGKVDRTADDIFDEHINNFNRQYNNANKLQKEFNNYIRCVRAVQSASKSLMDAICEIYEPQWSGYDSVLTQAQATDALWQEFSHKLGDQVLVPLNTYTGQFPEMKKKVEKRNRKLIDYDSQRHSFQNLQANASKRKDDVKLTKGREQLEEARRIYEILNTELHDELPALFDSRILFLVTNLQTLFASEQVFHSETSKLYAELEAIVDKLATDSQRGSYTLKKSENNALKIIPDSVKNKQNANYSNQTNNTSIPSPTTSNSPSNIETPSTINNNESINKNTETKIHNKLDQQNDIDNEPSYQNTPTAASGSSPLTNHLSNNVTSVENVDEEKDKNLQPQNPVSNNFDTKLTSSNNNENNKTEHLNGNMEKSIVKSIPIGAKTNDLPPGVLYRVKATYSYQKEDADELNFEVGDIIRVIEYDDPEDQEEGWLMGEKESTGEKGLFPANFTRQI